MHYKVMCSALSCCNKNSIWNKPTCKIIGNILFFLSAPIVSILIIIGFIIVAGILFAFSSAIMGAMITIIQIIAFITIITGLDPDGKINNFLYDKEGNLFAYGLDVLLNYQIHQYNHIFIAFFGMIGGCIVVLLIFCIIMYVVYLFIRDIKKYKKDVYKQNSCIFMFIMILTYVILAIIPLLLTLIGGIISGVIILLDWSPIGNIDNHAIYNTTVISVSNYYDTTYVIGISVGIVAIIVIPILIIILLLKCCITGCNKDFNETYYDIEAGEIYKVEKEL